MADNVIKLKVDSAEYEAKLKRATSGLTHLEESLRKSGKTFADVDKAQLKYIQALGNMETVSKTASGKLREMESAYRNLSATYHMLQKDQQNDEGGKALRSSLNELKVRIDETRQAMKKADDELNDFSKTENNAAVGSSSLNDVLGQIGGKLGINTSMLSGLTTGTMGYAAAVAAVVKVEYEAVKAFKEYNDELARQSQITGVTTGLKGPEADDMTAAARALSKVYGADFREVINAANTLMTQFGTDGASAINLIRQGMQGMIIGDAPKLLSMIQQYAPSFRDAGIEASQLVAIIQNSEGGIFTDENMNAIVMGIKNIRLMTKATSDALAEIGIDGKKMSQDLSDGTITIFEALRMVSKELENTESGSQQAGQVMQQVFGRQGTMAGTNLAKAIATLNINLEETKTQTGEVGQSFDKLAAKTEELDKALMSVLQVESWDALKNNIESGFVGALTQCVNLLGEALDIVNNIGDAFGGPVVQAVADFLVALTGPIGLIYEAYNLLKGEPAPKQETQEDKAQRTASTFIANINSSKDKAGAYAKNIAQLQKVLDQYMANGDKEKEELTRRVIEIVEEHMDKTFEKMGTDKKAGTSGLNKTAEAIKEINEEIKKVKKKAADAAIVGDDDAVKRYNQQLSQLKARLEALGVDTSKTKKKIVYTKESVGALTQELQKLQKAQKNATSNSAWKEYEKQIKAVKNQIKELKGELNNIEGGSMVKMKGVGIADWYLKDAKKNKEIPTRESIIAYGTSQIRSFKGYQGEDKKEVSLTKELGQITSGVSGIFSGIESLGMELPEGLKDVMSGIQGVISVLTGISTIISAIKAISAADAIFPFANGGIVHAAGGFVVPGNYNSGDLVPAALSSGEVVLNRAQQGVIANVLQQEQRGGGNGMARVSGEQIWLVLNAYTRRTGQGEIVTWK